MKKFFNTRAGRLRLLAFLEGVSLIFLVFLAVPLKYFFENPFLVKTIGPVHGVLFILFVFNTITVATEQDWKFKETTWQVLFAGFIPFGTFYIDHKILGKLATK